MKSLSKHIMEAFMHEEKFMRIDFITSKESGEDYDQIIGFVDKDTYLVLAVYVNGEKLTKRFGAIYQGEKYVADSIKRSWSKMVDITDIPAKWSNHFDELMKMYDIEVVNNAETKGIVE